MFKYHLWALLIGTILDFIFGRIYSIWNPFDSIKKLVKHLDRALLGDELILLEPAKQRSLGMWLIIIVLVPVFATVTFFNLLFYDIAPWLGVLFEAFATYLCIDGKYLYYGAKGVMADYYGCGIREMKHSYELFSGRESKGEDESEVTAETISYLANETSDGLISPLVIMLLFGPVGGFLYRSIDIIDQVVGYKNSRYLHFGYYGAKLSWAVSYWPARFSGALTVFAARYTFGDFHGRNARYIHLRDGVKAISAFAGALGIALKDKTVGDMDKEPEACDIRKAIGLMRNDFLLMQLIIVILLLIF